MREQRGQNGSDWRGTGRAGDGASCSLREGGMGGRQRLTGEDRDAPLCGMGE